MAIKQFWTISDAAVQHDLAQNPTHPFRATQRVLVADTLSEVDHESLEEGDLVIALDVPEMSVVTKVPSALTSLSASSAIAIADVTGLTAALAAKAASSHTHGAADITDATATPAASKIVIASASGKVDGWISDAAAGTKGLVDLNSVALVGDARLGGRIRAQEGFFRSPLPQASGSMFLESGYGYFVYIGQFLEAITLNYVNVHVSTGGAGSQTAEVGLFSTPLAPNRTGQTLTRLAAVSGMTAMTAAGYHRNSTPLAYTPAVGVPVWAAIRTVMGTTRVLVRGISFEMGQGAAFIKSAVGDLTSVSPVACTVQGHSTSSVGPDLWVTVD